MSLPKSTYFKVRIPNGNSISDTPQFATLSQTLTVKFVASYSFFIIFLFVIIFLCMIFMANHIVIKFRVLNISCIKLSI